MRGLAPSKEIWTVRLFGVNAFFLALVLRLRFVMCYISYYDHRPFAPSLSVYFLRCVWCSRWLCTTTEDTACDADDRSVGLLLVAGEARSDDRVWRDSCSTDALDVWTSRSPGSPWGSACRHSELRSRDL